MDAGQSALWGEILYYFENSRRAVYGQRLYAERIPGRWARYSTEIWRLTACDSPGDFEQAIGGETRTFFSYS